MNNSKDPVIYWLREDFRIHDNLALTEAAKDNKNLILVYFSNYLDKQPGSAQEVWINNSFLEITKKYDEIYGLNIQCYDGDPIQYLEELHKKFGVSEIYMNEVFDPRTKKKDDKIKKYFTDQIIFKTYNSHLLFNPEEIKNNAGSYFKVYTPFWRNCLSKLIIRKPLRPPKEINVFQDKRLKGTHDLSLNHSLWANRLFKYFTPGENAARLKLKELGNLIKGYSSNRDFPNKDSTSKFSMYFARGELSVNEVMFHLIRNKSKINKDDYIKFSSQIGWREFSYNILYNFPDLPLKNFNQKFDNFEWDTNKKNFNLWKLGQTGFPIVDAGMRELYETGYMHNRVRMITASFLVKDLLIDWRLGRKWFEETLLDHDIANNSAGWQWVAGSGTDAAPYFRIFNPSLQSERFDKEGNYIKKWIPELKDLPSKLIHSPWKFHESDLKKYEIELGKTYPYPIIDHGNARDKALMLYKKLK